MWCVDTLIQNKDKRFTKILIYDKFIQAFNIYKQIIVESYPHRRDKRNKYMTYIIGLAKDWPGFSFDEYHLDFSARATEQFKQG